MLRSVFVFVIVTALAFAAEAVLSIAIPPKSTPDQPLPRADLVAAEDE